ncbi:DUF2194 domain-containing protein [Flavobacterium myungsuense]|uniref:DUF2194 domain-containing protein n=1 Tax=Flavobacterium myungsuense TaxID=651823 RepID=A0ABW3J1G0_9FLAO
MKFINTKLKVSLKFLLFVLGFLAISSCEGLDDWSDLKIADLIDLKEDVKNEEDKVFKRYAELGMSNQPLIEFIVDEKEIQSKLYNANIKKTCDYTKLPFRSIPLNLWNSTIKIASSTRVLSVYDTKKLNDASIPKLLDFVTNGGTLFLPYANEDHRFSYFFGFIPEAEFATDVKSSGFYFNYNIFPNAKDKKYFSNLKHYGFASSNFSNKIKFLATALNNKNYPTIIENKIGTGRVILINSTNNFLKEDRGLLFAGILKGLEAIPYPVANTSTIFLDDFPSPLYNIMAEPIASEMNMNMEDFVKKVWWPDMKKLAKEYKIPYSAMTTFDYRNKIVPPFTLDQWNSRKITINNKTEPIPDWLVKDVANDGHEIAFHGYNHVSLLKHLWKNPIFINTSMNTVKKKWEISNFGKLPTTYVPPSNDIDKEGIKELKKAMPSLKYMCSLYLGIKKEGGDREFDYDPYNNDFFDYPRISSGFYMSEEAKYYQQSMYLFTGIWTHFVHPDDVFQIPSTANARAGHYSLRNELNYGWRKSKGSDKAMLPEFKKYIKQITNAYPQLRFLNGNDAAEIVIDWRASRYNHKSENGLYTISQTNPGEVTKQYWFMYGSAENAEKIEGRLKNEVALFSKTPFLDGYMYSIYNNKPKITILDLNYKTPNQKANQASLNRAVLEEVKLYNIAVKKFRSGAYFEELEKKKLNIYLASLKNKMINTPDIDSITWNKYSKYMSWDERGTEVWKLLDEHVKKYPTKENIMYSKELDRVIGYPNDAITEKWTTEQLLVNPFDKELLNTYINNYNTEENELKIRMALKNLYAIDNSTTNYKNYLRHLLEYDTLEAIKELSDKKPTEDFAEFGEQIVWLYADSLDYRKAIEWSSIAKNIDFATKMGWYIESGQSKLVEKEYLKYIAENPNDDKAKILMSNVYHEMGRFKEAWILANSLPESEDKEDLRKTYNKDVVYEEDEIQQYLIENESELFYPNVMKAIVKEYRLTKGDFVDFNSLLQTNQNVNSFFNNIFSYNFYDKKENLHSVGVTRTKYYKLVIDTNYPSNYENTLGGLEYKFKTAEIEGKPQYWYRARVEANEATKAYYQAGLGYSKAKEKSFRSAELNLLPVEFAPGLNQNIYNLRLSLNQDFYLFKVINTNISFEGNYYTNGLLSRDTINTAILNPNRKSPLARKVFTTIDKDNYEIATFDDGIEGALSLRMVLDKGVIRKSKFVPFIEGQITRGNRDLEDGYPYWMLSNRNFGGTGIGWEFKIRNFNSRVEAGYFLDDYTKNFRRYIGNLSYQLFDYTALTFNFEIYDQDKFYSNAFRFGVKYNLKKKTKKKIIIEQQ